MEDLDSQVLEITTNGAAVEPDKQHVQAADTKERGMEEYG